MNDKSMTLQPRWRDYVLIRGSGGNVQFREFWADHLNSAERSVLFVIGRGFDPRMCIGVGEVLETGGAGARDVIALDFREGPMSPSHSHQDRVDQNWTSLQTAVAGRGKLTEQRIDFWSSEGQRISSQSARDVFNSAADFDGHTDIVVDISAMPRSVYFPLIARILFLLDKQAAEKEPSVNLHIIVAEDPVLDLAIREEGVDERAEFVASFRGGYDLEATEVPSIWIPVLGENRTIQFERIYDLVKPDEICPILPFPSRNPRRPDDIVIEYQRILFDELRLDPRSFLYAAEQNPFDAYRQIRKAVLHYSSVFSLLGGCKVALSALSSKTMSLGAMLAAYELKELNYNIGVAHIECQGYTLDSVQSNPELVCLWLAGECYAT